MRNLFTKLDLLTQRDSGQTMAEYAVVLAVIAIGVFVALGVLSGAISGALDTVTAEISRPAVDRGPPGPRLLLPDRERRRIGASLIFSRCILPGCPSFTSPTSTGPTSRRSR